MCADDNSLLTFEEALVAIPALAAARAVGAKGSGRGWRVVIDGPSGAGKTTLADALAKTPGVLVLHLDDMYEGWNGLAVGSQIAQGLVSGEYSSYKSWDWERSERGTIVIPDPTCNWVVEGCGAITRVSTDFADATVWVHADPEVAKQRGIARDGESFASQWDTWRLQELRHWRDNAPRARADLVVAT